MVLDIKPKNKDVEDEEPQDYGTRRWIAEHGTPEVGNAHWIYNSRKARRDSYEGGSKDDDEEDFLDYLADDDNVI